MADHIDYAARYLEETIDDQMIDQIKDPSIEFPWVGMALLLFEYLIARGFRMVRDDVN